MYSCERNHRAAFALLSLLIALMFGAEATHAQNIGREAADAQRLEQAVQLMRANRSVQAEELLNAILSQNPQDADALNLLGVVRAQQRRYDEAERLFRRATAAAPTFVGTYVNLSELYLTTGRSPQALQTLLAAQRLAPTRPDINFKLAMLYVERKQYDTALKFLQLIPRNEADAGYFYLLIKSQLELNRTDEARRSVADFARIEDATPEIQARVAALLLEHNLPDEAVSLAQNARRRAPESFPILYTLGVAYRAAKQYDKADEVLTAALNIRPNDLNTLRAVASVARAQGNLEKALAFLVRAKRLAPDAHEVLYEFGVTSLQMNLLLDALPVFERLHQLRPNELAYMYMLGVTRLQKGAPSDAEPLFKRYVELRPDDASGLYLLGMTLYRMKRYPEARRVFERSLALQANVNIEYFIGVTFAEEENLPAAASILERVTRAHPEHVAVHTILGDVYRKQGRYAEARTVLERAVTLDPQDLRAHYQLGLVYAKLGEKEAAVKMFALADKLRDVQHRQDRMEFKLIEPPK